MFAFGTVAGLLYACLELFAESLRRAPLSAQAYAARAPLFAMLFCCVFALPFLKGAHGTERVPC